MPEAADYSVGDRVWCAVRTKAGEDMRVQATVVKTTDRRVTVEFRHWHDQERIVQRRVRPHRLEPSLAGPA